MSQPIVLKATGLLTWPLKKLSMPWPRNATGSTKSVKCLASHNQVLGSHTPQWGCPRAPLSPLQWESWAFRRAAFHLLLSRWPYAPTLCRNTSWPWWWTWRASGKKCWRSSLQRGITHLLPSPPSPWAPGRAASSEGCRPANGSHCIYLFCFPWREAECHSSDKAFKQQMHLLWK